MKAEDLRIDEVYQIAKSCHSFYDFENYMAKHFFSIPESAESKEFTNKLILTINEKTIQ